jgi:hypothetical protein
MRFASSCILITCITFFSCQQEPADIINQAQQCKITAGMYYGGSGSMNDSANFSYDTQGKLVKWKGFYGQYDYFYNGTNIVSRRYTEGTDLIYMDSVYYDAGNRITNMVFYDYSGMVADTVHTKIVFKYINNRLDNLLNIEYYDYGAGLMADTIISKMFWNAGGNIEKLVYYDTNNQPFDSILYQYNSDPNYFKVIHPNFFLLDPEFELYAGFEPHLPYFYSTNNVSNSNMYGTFDYPITYGLDSTSKVTSLGMGGFEYFRYRYQCP